VGHNDYDQDYTGGKKILVYLLVGREGKKGREGSGGA
jgi:hypothetical protein